MLDRLRGEELLAGFPVNPRRHVLYNVEPAILEQRVSYLLFRQIFSLGFAGHLSSPYAMVHPFRRVGLVYRNHF